MRNRMPEICRQRRQTLKPGVEPYFGGTPGIRETANRSLKASHNFVRRLQRRIITMSTTYGFIRFAHSTIGFNVRRRWRQEY